MAIGIYLIQNLADFKVYVGKSVDLKDRPYKHRHLLRKGKHPNLHLQAAWSKYVAHFGESIWLFDTLEECGEEELIGRESWWMDFFDSRSPEKGYNFWAASRSVRSGMTGRKHTEESKAKMRANSAMKRPEVSAKVVASRKGYTTSEETKEKLRQTSLAAGCRPPSWLGKKVSPEALAKRKASWESKTPEERAAIIEKSASAQRGVPRPKMAGDQSPTKRPEVRALLSAQKTGEKNPAKRPEVAAKISAANKGRVSPYKGKSSPFKGVPRSEEVKRKISETKRRNHEQALFPTAPQP